MEKKKELSFREMLGLLSDMPSWWYFGLSVIGFSLFAHDVVNSRFNGATLFILFTALTHSWVYVRTRGRYELEIYIAEVFAGIALTMWLGAKYDWGAYFAIPSVILFVYGLIGKKRYRAFGDESSG